jgi:hypothetical protein
VFVVVVPIGADEAAEEGFGEEVAEVSVFAAEGDLEIDEPGAAVFAEEDVFAFVGVDVGDVAGLEVVEELLEVSPELGGEGKVGVEICTGDEGVEEACGADAAKEGGDSADALEVEVDIDFVVGDEAASPAHGEVEEVVGTLDFEDGEVGGIFSLVEAGGGEEVVFEEFDEVVGDALGGDGGGELIAAEGEKVSGRALFCGCGWRRWRGFRAHGEGV